jgi:hypothetical protein
MPEGRWIALVTFERLTDAQDVLEDAEQGACGWMGALAPDADWANERIVRDLGLVGLLVVEIEALREVFSEDEIAETDAHLARNFAEIEGGKQTVWGTIHCYKGEGKA